MVLSLVLWGVWMGGGVRGWRDEGVRVWRDEVDV